MILLLDTSKNPIKVKFVAIKNKSSSEVAEQLRALIDARSKAVGKTEQEGTGIEVVVQPTANQLALIGNEVEIALAEELISTLDQEMPTSSAVFRLNYFSPDKMDEILRRMVEERSFKPPYRSRVEGSDLVIDSTPEILQLAEQLKSQLDTKNVPEEQSPIRFYKIKNVPAAELLETIQSIFSGGRIPSRKELPASAWGQTMVFRRGRTILPFTGRTGAILVWGLL
jgi:type II secretory pathway component GspD/PulD (secretin)